MKDANVKSVTADGHTVYDLDAAAKSVQAVSNFNLPAISAATAIGANVRQMAVFSESLMINQQFKVIQQLSESIMGPYRDMQKMLATSLASELQKSLVNSLAINFRFDWPRLYIPTLTEQLMADESVQMQPSANNGVLEIAIDSYGFILFDGQKSARANANTSMHGRLLSWLENNKGELVTNEEMKALFRPGQAKQVMKDLKKELRQLGLKLLYERYRGQGLVYRGVIKKQ